MGNFAEAVKWQTKAIDLAADAELRPWLEEQLALFRQGQPYHEPEGTLFLPDLPP